MQVVGGADVARESTGAKIRRAEYGRIEHRRKTARRTCMNVLFCQRNQSMIFRAHRPRKLSIPAALILHDGLRSYPASPPERGGLKP